MIGNLHVGLAAIGAALAVGLIGMAASDAVGRNPGASTQILVQSILAIAFAEAIVFYTLFWWDRRNRRAGEPKAALSRMLGRESGPEPESIVTRVLEYWGITTFLGTPTKGSPGSYRMRAYDYECSSIASDGSNDASSR